MAGTAMTPVPIALLLAVTVLVHSAVAHNASLRGSWSYRDTNEWTRVPGWECNATGIQSPININTSAVLKEGTSLHELSVRYGGSADGVAATAETNNHTWELHFPEGTGVVEMAGRVYTLRQFHFHSPSENTVDGQFANMEGHMVHESADGHLLVLAQLFHVGKHHAFMGQFWDAFPHSARINSNPVTVDNPYNLMHPSHAVSYYMWMGSTTTPPCTTQVTWILAQDHHELSQLQLDAFRQSIDALPGSQEVIRETPPGVNGRWDPNLGDDNRPVQPLGMRHVLGFNGASH